MKTSERGQERIISIGDTYGKVEIKSRLYCLKDLAPFGDHFVFALPIEGFHLQSGCTRPDLGLLAEKQLSTLQAKS